MNIVLISYVIPTESNCRGASALPYHLAKYRPHGVGLSIYTFNGNDVDSDKINKIEAELQAKIVVMKKPLFYTLLLKFRLLRFFVHFPLMYYMTLAKYYVKKIDDESPDGIWVYSEEWDKILRQFPQYKRVHLFPDCESLFYSRLLCLPQGCDKWLDRLKNRLMRHRFREMEASFDGDELITNCLVGEMDVKEFRRINRQAKAVFLRHPHYNIGNSQKEIHFSNPKIKLLIAGRNDFYMQVEAEAAIKALCNDATLQECYEITFLGTGWEQQVALLRQTNFSVQHIDFVPDYIQEISKYDIQLSPITIGTGTKGKVLDALANGLLTIGTPYAMENIAVEDGVSCIVYDTPKHLIEKLHDIENNRKQYESVAVAGREAILMNHNREQVSQKFFKLFS